MRVYYPHFGGEYRAGEHRWYFPAGGTVALGHMQHDGDEYNYQTAQFQFVAFDEATQFLPKQLLYMFSRCRSTNPAIPKRMRYSTNPGGPAHQFLKDRFRLGQFPQGRQTFYEDVDISLSDTVRIRERISRVFIPAKLVDNPSLWQNDPGYVARLKQLPELEQMRLIHGVWDAFEGQAISELNYELHANPPSLGFFKAEDIPPEWYRFRTFDWGSSAPFTVLWWAVDYDGRLYIYRQWYGSRVDEMRNKVVGLKMSAAEIAKGIMDREKPEREKHMVVNAGPADPSIWNKRRDPQNGIIGPSVADEMAAQGVYWLRGDNDRILGRQQLHSRLRVDDDGVPMLFISHECKDWWRTIPQLTEDPKNPEDILQRDDVEDHDYDCTRYGVMSRPLRPVARPAPDVGSFQYERRKHIRAKQYARQHGVSLAQAYRTVKG